MSRPPRRRLKATAATKVAPRPRYVLDQQIGFLMRIAMQRHTAIFMSRMIAGLTQTQFAALAQLAESTRAPDLSRRRDHQGRGRSPPGAPFDQRLPGSA